MRAKALSVLNITELPQEMINEISYHFSCTKVLVNLLLTSKKMKQLIANTPAGKQFSQLAGEIKELKPNFIRIAISNSIDSFAPSLGIFAVFFTISATIFGGMLGGIIFPLVYPRGNKYLTMGGSIGAGAGFGTVFGAYVGDEYIRPYLIHGLFSNRIKIEKDQNNIKEKIDQFNQSCLRGFKP